MSKKFQLSKLAGGKWESLTDAERESVFQEMDAAGPRLAEAFQPLTKAQRERLSKMPSKAEYERKRRGRPKLGGVGARRILITIEPRLLARADAYAKRHKLNRSSLISQALERATAE